MKRRVYIKKSRRGLFGIILLTLVICVFCFFETRDCRATLNQKQKSLKSLENTKNELEAKQKELKKKTGELTNEEIIKIARERLNLVFPDEIIVQPKKNGK